MSWQQGTVYRTMTFSTPCGVPVDGWVSEMFGLHRVEFRGVSSPFGGRGWSVTHLKTGLCIGILEMADLVSAQKWADYLATTADWNSDEFCRAPSPTDATRLAMDHILFVPSSLVNYWSIHHEPAQH